MDGSEKPARSTDDAATVAPERSSRRDRFLPLLRPFGDVRHDEAVTAGSMALAVFLLLAAYYVLKVVREPLIMLGGGAEVKRYAAAGQLLLLLAALRGYDALAARFDSIRLVAAVNLFFVLNLVIFFLLGTRGVPIGVPFFLWVGIFNVTMVAQFWALANDIYTEEQGRRLFGVVAIGSSIGAVTGAHLAGALFVRLGPFRLMMVAALILVVCLALMILTHRRESRRLSPVPASANGALGDGRALGLLIEDRYLLLVAAVTLLFNSVNSTGEYILDRRLLEEIAGMATSLALRHQAEQYIGSFRASFYAWVNFASLALQMFVVSRVMYRLGLRVALFITPLASMGAYAMMALLPRLGVTAGAKAVEDSLGYSFQNTGLHSLFLITSREAKYRAKTAVDTIFWRAGDLLSAGLVLLGSSLALRLTTFAWINFTLALVWVVVVIGVSRLHRRRSHLEGVGIR